MRRNNDVGLCPKQDGAIQIVVTANKFSDGAIWQRILELLHNGSMVHDIPSFSSISSTVIPVKGNDPSFRHWKIIANQITIIGLGIRKILENSSSRIF